jgi:hypothetical protein
MVRDLVAAAARECIRQRDEGEKAWMRDLGRVGGGDGLVLDLSPT